MLKTLLIVRKKVSGSRALNRSLRTSCNYSIYMHYALGVRVDKVLEREIRTRSEEHEGTYSSLCYKDLPY